MKGQTFGLRFEIKQCAEGEDCNQGEILSGGNSLKELFCVARTNVFEISGEGSRQLKLFWASLTLQGPECLDPTFSTSRIKRRGQREKVVSSNRLPGFRFRAYSGRFFTSRILPKNRFVSQELFYFLNSRKGLLAV